MFSKQEAATQSNVFKGKHVRLDDEEEDEPELSEEEIEDEEDGEEEDEEESESDEEDSELKQELNKMSFEDVQKLQNKIGLKKYDIIFFIKKLD